MERDYFKTQSKLMKDFKFQPSPNTKTAKKQTEHFERNCHQVLKNEVIKSGDIVKEKTSTRTACSSLSGDDQERERSLILWTSFIKKSSVINKKYDGTNKLKTEMDTLIASFLNISIPKKQQRLNICTTGPAHDSKGKSAMYEPYISSDTATLEVRPLKQNVNTNPNLSSLTIISKRFHQVSSSIIALDSEQAGPSKVNHN
ncbi:hypothetical protein C1646_765094 [Rhizophagus diaphanus]|nr:hypothetical protein C1646_765094 [Rhizophagus diaphanus] [Rhizophagus sp. MUCL 43196]